MINHLGMTKLIEELYSLIFLNFIYVSKQIIPIPEPNYSFNPVELIIEKIHTLFRDLLAHTSNGKHVFVNI